MLDMLKLIRRNKLEDVGEWCKEHWKEIVLAIEIIVAVVCLFVPGLQGIGTGILIGALKGAITGGLIGGITSALSGGSFLEGFAQGALDGAIMGGALGGVGGIAGKFITCGSKLGNAIQTTAKVSGTISDGMDGFDMLSMGLGMIDPNNPITELNSKLHQSDLYNSFQMGVSMVSSFTGAASQNMACFIAGTTILTATGFVAIEKLVAGDKVISTNPDTLETAEKTVLETYVRQVDKLVHLTINGEEIVTTDNHPFYVQGRGFIEAGNLLVGDKLISVNGEDLVIEKFFIEECESPVTVHNFQVEDFHTYFVGDCAVWVHNKNCKPRSPKSDVIEKVENADGSITYTKNINGKNVNVTYSKEGYPDFSPYSHPDYPDPVEINMTGNNYNDFKEANKAIGLSGANPPDGYTWHHLEDGKHMLLVDSDIHDATSGGFPHTGGASIVRNK